MSKNKKSDKILYTPFAATSVSACACSTSRSDPGATSATAGLAAVGTSLLVSGAGTATAGLGLISGLRPKMGGAIPTLVPPRRAMRAAIAARRCLSSSSGSGTSSSPAAGASPSTSDDPSWVGSGGAATAAGDCVESVANISSVGDLSGERAGLLLSVGALSSSSSSSWLVTGGTTAT